MSSRTRRQLLTGLALIALAWAQLFGMTRGYLCDCSGEPKVTALDHCHGPHSTACHDHEAADACHEHENLPPDDDTHQHQPVTEPVLAQQTMAKGCTGAPPVMALVATLEFWNLSQKLDKPFVIPTALLHDDGGGRQWPKRFAHTIALRV